MSFFQHQQVTNNELQFVTQNFIEFQKMSEDYEVCNCRCLTKSQHEHCCLTILPPVLKMDANEQ